MVDQGLKHWTQHCTSCSMIMGNIYIYIGAKSGGEVVTLFDSYSYDG